MFPIYSRFENFLNKITKFPTGLFGSQRFERNRRDCRNRSESAILRTIRNRIRTRIQGFQRATTRHQGILHFKFASVGFIIEMHMLMFLHRSKTSSNITRLILLVNLKNTFLWNRRLGIFKKEQT